MLVAHILKQNPYVLCESKMVQFRIADKIASDLGFSLDHPDRVDTVVSVCTKRVCRLKGTYFFESVAFTRKL